MEHNWNDHDISSSQVDEELGENKELVDEEQNDEEDNCCDLGCKNMVSTVVEVAPKPDSQRYETICWGCGQHLYLASFAPLFKCAWCGAITSEKDKWKQSHWSAWNKVRDCLLIAIVLAFFASIVYGGVWAIFPVMFKDSSFSLFLHWTITTILASNVFLNYVLAIWVSPGPPRPVTWGSTSVVTQGFLEGHRFCNFCKVPKAPRVHHCSTCKQCVLDLDHHCPFIGNCVGANSIRHFLSFLLSALLGSLYALCLSICTASRVWPLVIGLHNGVGVKRIGPSIGSNMLASNALGALVSTNLELSLRALVLVYLVLSSLSTVVGVLILLHHQIHFVCNGYTFLESIQYGATATIKTVTTKRGWSNMVDIFAGQHAIFWSLPTFLPPYAPCNSKKPHRAI